MPTSKAYQLKPARVFDACSEEAHEGWCVLVTDGEISAVGPQSMVDSSPLLATAEVIALPGVTLLPGLIDAHSHLFLHPYNETPWADQVLKESIPLRTIRAVQHARDTLLSGFTTLRDLGTEGAGYADVDLQRAISTGLVPGPRLFVATLATTARHCYGPSPMAYRWDTGPVAQGALGVSGEVEMVDAVREQASHGADWIKLYADYHVGKGGKRETRFKILKSYLIIKPSLFVSYSHTHPQRGRDACCGGNCSLAGPAGGSALQLRRGDASGGGCRCG